MKKDYIFIKFFIKLNITKGKNNHEIRTNKR